MSNSLFNDIVQGHLVPWFSVHTGLNHTRIQGSHNEYPYCKHCVEFIYILISLELFGQSLNTLKNNPALTILEQTMYSGTNKKQFN